MKKLEIATQSGDWYDETRPEESMRFIKECGFEGIDYNINNLFADTFDGEALTSFFDKTVEELYAYFQPMKEASEKYGVSISQAHALFPVYNESRLEDNPYLIKAVEKMLAACQYLGCKSLVVHPWFSNTSTREEEREINLQMYRNLIPSAKKYGVKICLENAFSLKNQHIIESSCSNVEEVCWYIDTLNKEAGEEVFGFCFDIGHANVLGKDVYQFVKTLGKRLSVLHIHDNNGTEDAHMIPYTQQKGFESTMDWEGFLLALKEIGYEGPLSFETFRGVNALPKEVHKEALKLVSAIGRYFRNELE